MQFPQITVWGKVLRLPGNPDPGFDQPRINGERLKKILPRTHGITRNYFMREKHIDLHLCASMANQSASYKTKNKKFGLKLRIHGTSVPRLEAVARFNTPDLIRRYESLIPRLNDSVGQARQGKVQTTTPPDRPHLPACL